MIFVATLEPLTKGTFPTTNKEPNVVLVCIVATIICYSLHVMHVPILMDGL